MALPTSWEKPLPDVSASPGALGLSAPTLPVTEALSLPQVAMVYRQKLAQVHDDLELHGWSLLIGSGTLDS